MSLESTVTAVGVALMPVAVMTSSYLTLRGQRGIKAKVDGVHKEVQTTNGRTLATLADRTEGRRIIADVPARERTAEEQDYVDMLDPKEKDSRP